MNNNLTSEKGFTLLEVLLAITILTTVMVSLGGAIVNVMSVMAGEEAENSIRQRGRLGIEKMIDDLREAQEIEIIDDSKIKFKGYDQNGDLQWMTYKKYRSGGISALGLDKGRTMPVINNISSLKFVDVNGDQTVIKIILKVLGDTDDEKIFIDYVRTGTGN